MRESDKRTILRDVLMITFLALLLRTSNNLSSSFFYDEAVYADYGRHPLWTQFYHTMLDPPVLPLLAFLIRTFVGPSELLFRVPSIIVGCATVALTYLLGRQVSGRSAGLVSATLLALNTLHQQYSQAATTHVYLTFYTILALYGVARKNTLITYAGLLGALYTNDLSVILMLAYALFLWQSEGVKGTAKRISPVVLLYLPRIPNVLNVLVYEGSIKTFHTFQPFYYVEVILNHSSLALVLGVFYYAVKRIRSRATTFDVYLVLVFVVVSPFLIYFQRYALFVIPALTVAGVLGWVMFYERHVRQCGRKAFYAAGVLFAFLLFIPNPHAYGVYPWSSLYLLPEEMIHKEQWREAARLVDGGLILVSQNRPSLVYYMDETGGEFQVGQFDTLQQLKGKVENPSVRWVIIRNFKSEYWDYGGMIEYMSSLESFRRAYELEYLVVFRRSTSSPDK